MRYRRFIEGIIALFVAVAAVGISAALSMGSAASATTADAAFCGPNRKIPAPGAGAGDHPGFDAHMTVGPGVTVSGARPPIRIVNSGRDMLEWGAQRIDRSIGGSWTPMRLPGGPWEPALSILVLPESISVCEGPETGRGWPSGMYRWTLNVKALSRSGAVGHHVLRAVFPLRSR